MSRAAAMLAWLEDKSDWLSPIVVKEVRQVVRGREFAYSFGAGLVAGLTISFFGAADALSGNGTSGSWTFYALIACVAFLGFGVVPLGAFSALRNERMEQTLELITLTELSPRRIIIGKLLAQAVKLMTLFAAMAPFVAMSFLLGGVDFLTILVALSAVFLWSIWACALCLFLSTLFNSRAMSGLVFAGVALAMLLLFTLVRGMYFFATRAAMGVAAPGFLSSPWWLLGLTTTFCLVSMVNLVLLAENRLALAHDEKVTALRVGFLLQLLVMAPWLLSYRFATARVVANMIEMLGTLGGWHIAVVAMFAVTDDLTLSRRTRLREQAFSAVRRTLDVFRGGGGRGAVYVLLQMAVLLMLAGLFKPSDFQWRWLTAVCGYILFFTGVPVCIFRTLRPTRHESLKLRIAVFVSIPAALILPDLLYYLLWRPDALDLKFGARHLINPFRALSNWTAVEAQGWTPVPLVLGLTGLVAYAVLIALGGQVAADENAATSSDAPETAETSDRAGVLN